MRKLIVTEYLTADGITEGFEQWFFPFWDDEIGRVKHNELFASDTLIYGRVTYQLFAAQWMSKTSDDSGFAARLHAMPKYVVSRTLTTTEWNNSSLIGANVADEVRKIKAQPGEDILVAGSATLVETLREHDLVDEYRLMVFPVLWGNGKRFFADGKRSNLKLESSQVFGSGVVLQTYRPEP